MSIENRTSFNGMLCLENRHPGGMLCECKSTLISFTKPDGAASGVNLDYYNANCYIDIAPQTLKSNAKKTSESGGAHVLKNLIGTSKIC